MSDVFFENVFQRPITEPVGPPSARETLENLKTALRCQDVEFLLEWRSMDLEELQSQLALEEDTEYLFGEITPEILAVLERPFVHGSDFLSKYLALFEKKSSPVRISFREHQAVRMKVQADRLVSLIMRNLNEGTALPNTVSLLLSFQRLYHVEKLLPYFLNVVLKEDKLHLEFICVLLNYCAHLLPNLRAVCKANDQFFLSTFKYLLSICLCEKNGPVFSREVLRTLGLLLEGCEPELDWLMARRMSQFLELGQALLEAMAICYKRKLLISARVLYRFSTKVSRFIKSDSGPVFMACLNFLFENLPPRFACSNPDLCVLAATLIEVFREDPRRISLSGHQDKFWSYVFDVYHDFIERHPGCEFEKHRNGKDVLEWKEESEEDSDEESDEESENSLCISSDDEDWVDLPFSTQSKPDPLLISEDEILNCLQGNTTQTLIQPRKVSFKHSERQMFSGYIFFDTVGVEDWDMTSLLRSLPLKDLRMVFNVYLCTIRKRLSYSKDKDYIPQRKYQSFVYDTFQLRLGPIETYMNDLLSVDEGAVGRKSEP